MPYRQVYEPAPKNMSLEVSKELPEGFVETFGWDYMGTVKVAQNSQHEPAYFCHYKDCEGWIMGRVNSYEEDTIGILSGRRGTAYYCRRCGNEIGFSGMVS